MTEGYLSQLWRLEVEGEGALLQAADCPLLAVFMWWKGQGSFPNGTAHEGLVPIT